MGRILDVLRRKRSQPSTPLRSGELCHGCSAIHTNPSRDEEIDKENEKPRARRPDAKESKMLLPLCAGDDHHAPSLKSFDGDDSENSFDPTLENYMKVNEQAVGSGEESSIGEHFPSQSFHMNESIDEFTEVSDEVALASISESEHSSEAAAASVSEVTEVSDDGILRDDEGNPIDPNEAEENMLRDDEGNIIDPKTLVLRDSFVDISESDEYYDDDPGEIIDPKELISFIAEQGPLAITDDSTSEGEADSDFRVIPLHVESFPSHSYHHASQDNWLKEPPSPLAYCDGKSCKIKGTKERQSAFSRRRQHRDRRSFSTGNGEYVHIMFQDKLSTLVEESWTVKRTTSREDMADYELPWSSRSRPRSPKLGSSGSFDEKFILARWEYYLQVTNSGSFAINGPLIDARDEINDMMRPSNTVPDDSSVEFETGEI